MELVSLYYFTELAKDLHMTRTAERLYVSQQTLSNHIARLPFCLLENRIGERIRECFAESRVTPWAYITSTYTHISASVCFQRLAAAFIPHICLAEQRKEIPDDINIFPLLHNGRPLIQQVNLIRLRERFLPRPHRYFQDLLSGYLRAVEQVHLERTV